MRHTKAERAQNLAERWCWEVARRAETRGARRLYREQEGDGVYRLDAGAVLDEISHALDQIGVTALLAAVHGTVMQRERVPSGPDVLLYGWKTRFGSASMNALPALLFSDAVLMPRVGFHAQHVRQEKCQRGAAPRQGSGPPGRSARRPWPTSSSS